mmetsp:Transcript_58943/g.152305  ORF Transcript_58943/g.152305 Transcript_58943/m.152305 type:complete len:107 (-) Transcript_58943:144-464(-)
MAAHQQRRTLGATLLAAAALVLLRSCCCSFVGAPPQAAPRAAPAVQQVASMAGAAAFSLVADPALASDYDDRQGTAALALVGVCILGVVVSGIFFAVGKTMVEKDD